MLELKGIGDTNINFTLEGKTVVIIGRGNGSDFKLDSPKLSRKHCLIKIDNGRVTIEDLGSKNGTRINGKKIKRTTQFNPGDELGFSDAFSFVLQGPQVDETATPVDPGYAPAVADGDPMEESMEVLPARRDDASALPAVVSNDDGVAKDDGSKKRLILIGSLSAAVFLLVAIAMLGGDPEKPPADPGPGTPNGGGAPTSVDNRNYEELLNYVVKEIETNQFNPEKINQALDAAIRKETENNEAHIIKDIVKLETDANGDYERFDWIRAQKLIDELLDSGPDSSIVNRWAVNYKSGLIENSKQINHIIKMNSKLKESNWLEALEAYQAIKESSPFREAYKDRIEVARKRLYQSNFDAGQRHMGNKKWSMAVDKLNKAKRYSTEAQAKSIDNMITRAELLRDQEGWLDSAITKKSARKFEDAIRIAGKIPKDTMYYDQAQELIKDVEQKIKFKDAISHYDSGNADQALKILSQHRGNESHSSKIKHVVKSLKDAKESLAKQKLEEAIGHWKVVTEVEENKSNSYYLDAQSMLQLWNNESKLGATYKRWGDNAYASQDYLNARKFYDKAKPYVGDEIDRIYSEMSKMANRYYNIGLNFQRLNKMKALKNLELAKALSSPKDSVYLEADKIISEINAKQDENQ